MSGKLKKLSPVQALEAVGLYDRGMSLQPIALYYKVSRQAMWDLLRRRTTMRPQRRFAKDNHFYREGKRANDHAQNMVESAIRRGILIPKDVCETCGKRADQFKDKRRSVQAHHCDYNKPLDVMWLCQPCHHLWHKLNRAVVRS